MALVKCEKCKGKGVIEIEEKELTLMDVLGPFLKLKIKDGAEIPRLKPLDYPEEQANKEAFGDVVKRIHGVE